MQHSNGMLLVLAISADTGVSAESHRRPRVCDLRRGDADVADVEVFTSQTGCTGSSSHEGL